MRGPTTRLQVFILALALLIGWSAAQAQTLGEIQGVVRDDTGAAIPGAKVTVTNQDTGLTRDAWSDEHGLYKARALPSGTYSVTGSLEGMQTLNQENVVVLVGQSITINFALTVASIEEVITVTSESPLIESSRSSAASYVSEKEIEALPINGRDYKEFAFLAPTVQNDTSRGFLTMSGQRGTNSGLTIDGADFKSAFFGYGTGGEATENGGLVVAQDSVKEFQVVTSGFAPEFGASGGGYLNVITRSGTNDLAGTGFFFFRDQSLATDIPASPLDVSRGNTDSTPVDDFERQNFGLSVGGAIKQDKTHYFLGWDESTRTTPFTDDFNTRGGYDAILQRAINEPDFAILVDGYTPNDDGIAAPDPDLGRTASGTFLRSVDNTILFGKLDHSFTPSQNFTFRVNYTDYQRLSTFKDEESDKTEQTESWLVQLVSVFGSNKINELRAVSSSDNLDRLSQRVGEPIEALIRFRSQDGAGRDQVGKFDFLPIFVEEKGLQIQDNFSYLFGSHDAKFGVDYQKNDLSQLFAGSADGRYDFNTLEDFLNNDSSNVRIYYGNVQNPNYDETQSLFSLYAQDNWRPSAKLTVNYGLRFSKTDNPGNLPHLFPEGENIPDDSNWAPRLGFAYSPSDQDVFRGGVGLFFSRTPSLLFASQVQQNGLFPNFGRLNLGPDDPAFVPCCGTIDNENPPADAPNSPAFVDPSFEDPETWRLNLGYERQFAGTWAAGIDFVYADTTKLQSNVELNRTLAEIDEFGRPVFSPDRPDQEFNEIFTRQSISRSEYTAVTLSVRKRFSAGSKIPYQLQAHYTYAKDQDNDSNERSATGVTISSYTASGRTLASFDNNYDWGLSNRDVKNRLVVSGLVQLPLDFRISGVVEIRSGTPYTGVDGDNDFAYCGFSDLGFNCPDTRGIQDGKVVKRNSFRNDSISRIDLRLGKLFTFGDWGFDLFAQVFNLTNDNTFNVRSFSQRDLADTEEFGLGNSLATTPRQWELGVRMTFR